MKFFFLFLIFLGLYPSISSATSGDRLSVGAGLIHFNAPSKTYVELGLEYERRYSPMIGIGGFGNYIFSTPGSTILGVPEVFLHPLASDFYVSASPIFEFGSGRSTDIGVRLGTRIPLPIGLFVLVPTFSVDFINGGRDYILGVGLQF